MAGGLDAKRVLVIDDDPNLRQLLERIFSQGGAQVCVASGGGEGLRQFYLQRPDLVVLDVMLPDMDGWEVCRRIRQLSNVPIMFLSALGGERDIVRGLDLGAVDYVVKPFSPQVLLARARASLRQAELASGAGKPPTYQDDYLTIDLERRQVWVHGEPVKLTATEYRLLAYLVQNAGLVLTFEQILEQVWGWEYRESVDYVHVYTWHLRQKLEVDPRHPRYVLTEHGACYRFQKEPPVPSIRQRGEAVLAGSSA